MNSLSAMFVFELKRLVTPARSFWWVCIAAFPAIIIFCLQTFGDITDVSTFQRQMLRMRIVLSETEAQQLIDYRMIATVFYLATGIACMLGALLTASPAIASELEQHSWIYFATRPNGLFHLVMGKYLVAVVWAGSASLVAVWLSMLVADIQNRGQVTWVLSQTTVMSAMAYSALYLMIGTLFYRRAMIFCVGYTLAVEFFMSIIPAVINRLTIQYRLRGLVFQAIDNPDLIQDDEFKRLFFTDETPMMLTLWLVSLTAVFLAVALTSVQVREFTGAAETEST